MPNESRAAALCQQPSRAKLCHGLLQLFPGRGTAQNTQHLQDESCQQDETRSESDSHGSSTAPCQICSVLSQPLAAIPSHKGVGRTKGGWHSSCQCLGLLRQSICLELCLDIQNFFFLNFHFLENTTNREVTVN